MKVNLTRREIFISISQSLNAGRGFPKFGFEFKNPFIISYLYSLSSNQQVSEISCKFNETLILGPICPNFNFRYKTLIYCCYIRFYYLQIGPCANFKSKSIKI